MRPAPSTQAMPGAASASALPSAAELSALGSVLCLYPSRYAELDGWRQAVRASTCSVPWADGAYESLRFHDVDGRCCWRLCLLPDSDFLAWEALARRLPGVVPEPAGVAERLWRRLAEGVSGAAWRGSILRFALDDRGGPARLAACLSTPSLLGADLARRIAHAEGIVDGARFDDCCCARAAQAMPSRQAPSWHPLRFDKSHPAP
jgi:hypothetical protein